MNVTFTTCIVEECVLFYLKLYQFNVHQLFSIAKDIPKYGSWAFSYKHMLPLFQRVYVGLTNRSISIGIFFRDLAIHEMLHPKAIKGWVFYRQLQLTVIWQKGPTKQILQKFWNLMDVAMSMTHLRNKVVSTWHPDQETATAYRSRNPRELQGVSPS